MPQGKGSVLKETEPFSYFFDIFCFPLKSKSAQKAHKSTEKRLDTLGERCIKWQTSGKVIAEYILHADSVGLVRVLDEEIL